MKRYVYLTTAALVAAMGGCGKPARSGGTTAPAVATGGGLAVQGSLLPADRAKRSEVVKTAALNFVENRYAIGQKWPGRVEDILPASLESQPVNPAGYRLATAGAPSRPASKTPVVFEARTLQDGGFVGYADGSSKWQTAAELKADLPPYGN